ncbi:hypothetical protein LCGC14_2482340, partial [marine sediment metagenome]
LTLQLSREKCITGIAGMINNDVGPG